TSRAVTWLFEVGPSRGWLDPRTLPLAPTSAAQPAYAGWERLAAFGGLSETLGQDDVLDVFDLAANPATTAAGLLQTLSQRSGWALTDLTFLAGAGGLGLSFPTSYQDERALARLAPCFELIT